MSIDAILAGFNAAEVTPQTARTLLPKGWYTVVISNTTNKINKAGTGSYLELELQVVDGEHNGRRVWDRLNLDNPNQTAVDIAKASLSSICHAVGALTPRTPEDLKDKPLEALIDIQPAKGEYSESNVVRGYQAVQGSKPKAKAKKPTVAQLAEADDDELPF
jgi:hypothetical protein